MHPDPSRNRRLRVLVAPDSFKGSASAHQVAEALAVGWREVRPDDLLRCLPQADGGEGTLTVLDEALPGAERIEVSAPVPGPLGRPVSAWWLRWDEVAIVELALTCGLPLVDDPSPATALAAHTEGLGAVLQDVARHGLGDVVVAVGGSASTDGGLGALSHLTVTAVDRLGRPVPSGGQHLTRIDTLHHRASPFDRVRVLTDVRAPLTGPTGAAAVFAPQKGADRATVQILDAALTHWARLWGVDAVTNAAGLPGAGAAGGVGFGFVVGLGAELLPGADWVSVATGLDDAMATADVLITGEGRLDEQSFTGKVVGHVLGLPGSARRCVVAGQVLASGPQRARPGEQWQIDHLVSLTRLAGSSRAAQQQPEHWLRAAGRQLAREFRPG